MYREAELNRAAYYSGNEEIVSLTNNTAAANITTLTDVRTLNDTVGTNGEEEEGQVDDGPAMPVKLVGGHSSMEGRLMVSEKQTQETYLYIWLLVVWGDLLL